MAMKKPAHPGQILKMMYLDALEITITDAAKSLDMPRVALSEIINGRRSVSPQTAVKLAKCFGSRPEFWMDLQSKFDLSSVDSRCADKVSVLWQKDTEMMRQL